MIAHGSHGATLKSGSVYNIVVDHDVVWCTVRIRTEVTPAEGAQAAHEMTHYLVNQVVGQAFYSGVLFDVTEGPAVFGPSTRGALGGLFLAAERKLFPVAALVKAHPIQHLQFASLVRESGGQMGAVHEERAKALHWIRTKMVRGARSPRY